MKLNEIVQNMITVRVNQGFSDKTFDWQDTHLIQEYDSIDEVEEKVKPLVQVLTPTENDYRGMADTAHAAFADQMSQDTGRPGYADTPELAYYVGLESGNIYQRDLLNDDGEHVMQFDMTEQQFMQILNQYIVKDKRQGLAN